MSLDPVNPIHLRELVLRVLNIPDQRSRDLALIQLHKLYPHCEDQIRYADDPCAWGRDRLGMFFWSVQRQIMESVRDHRQTAVYSCHRIGKSLVVAVICHWWIRVNHPGSALVITSAHSRTQMKMALWREMARVHTLGKLPGRMNQTEYLLTMPSGKEEVVALGRKPADDDMTSLHGMYSLKNLVALDEACYVADALFDGLDTLISSEGSRAIVFGNPDDSRTRFAKICQPGSGWNVIQVGYEDTPNFTDEQVPESIKANLISPTWVRERAKGWGVKSVLYVSKVLGQFPETSENTFFPLSWLKRAQERFKFSEHKVQLPLVLGVDVSGGGDKNVVCKREGMRFTFPRKDNEPDTMKTLENLINHLREDKGFSRACVDMTGLGRGMVERAGQMSRDQEINDRDPELAEITARIHGIESAAKAEDEKKYVNLRAELYGLARELLEIEDDDGPAFDDDDLINQLANIRVEYITGRMQVESKKSMRSRGISSPDEADSFVFTLVKASYLKKLLEAREERGRIRVHRSKHY